MEIQVGLDNGREVQPVGTPEDEGSERFHVWCIVSGKREITRR